VVALLLFLQLRILDEYKDFDDDRRYRPYRPVPRGIVTLRALGRLGVAAAAVQAVASALLGMPVVAVLVVVWAYAGLMAVEFFARNWLRARPALYLASHMVVVPLVVAHGAACAGARPPFLPLAGFAAMSYFTFCVFEIGRKIRSPADEQEGVETYSAAWGRRRAVFAWLAAMAAAGLFAAIAAREIDALRPAVVLIPVIVLAGGLSGRFLHDPKPGAGKAFLAVSGVWMVVGFLVLGVGAGMRLQG
jgi:4-hydroxybenzoate polyprenyltransferase